MNHPASPPPHAVELSIHQALQRAENYVRREPAKAVLAALGAGMLFTLMPRRLLMGATATLDSRLMPPVLIGLGLVKAFELCCERDAARNR